MYKYASELRSNAKIKPAKGETELFTIYNTIGNILVFL